MTSIHGKMITTISLVSMLPHIATKIYIYIFFPLGWELFRISSPTNHLHISESSVNWSHPTLWGVILRRALVTQPWALCVQRIEHFAVAWRHFSDKDLSCSSLTCVNVSWILFQGGLRAHEELLSCVASLFTNSLGSRWLFALLFSWKTYACSRRTLSVKQYNMCDFDQVVRCWFSQYLSRNWTCPCGQAIQVLFSVTGGLVNHMARELLDRLLARNQRHTGWRVGVSVMFAAWLSIS